MNLFSKSRNCENKQLTTNLCNKFNMIEDFNKLNLNDDKLQLNKDDDNFKLLFKNDEKIKIGEYSKRVELRRNDPFYTKAKKNG